MTIMTAETRLIHTPVKFFYIWYTGFNKQKYFNELNLVLSSCIQMQIMLEQETEG